MSTIAANYRSFRLPWTPSEAEERLFRRIVGATIGLFIAFGIVIPLLPQPPVIQPLAARGIAAHRRIHPDAAQTASSRGTEADRGAEGADEGGDARAGGQGRAQA